MNNILSRSVLLRNAKKNHFRRMATKIEDVCTHTGQKWDSDDYRMARFMHAPKVVNPKWAVHLIMEIKPTPVVGRKVWCDGGSGAEGHPRIYINLDKPGPQFCMYCSRGFVQVFKNADPCKKD